MQLYANFFISFIPIPLDGSECILCHCKRKSTGLATRKCLNRSNPNWTGREAPPPPRDEREGEIGLIVGVGLNYPKMTD